MFIPFWGRGTAWFEVEGSPVLEEGQFLFLHHGLLGSFPP